MKRRFVIVILSLLLVLVVAFGAGMALLSLSASRPQHLGVRDGRLAACPESPNCVSTQADDQQHWIAPLEVPDGVPHPLQQLSAIIAKMPGGTIVSERDDYLYVEFRSTIFRFCDDVEFLLEPGSRRIHFRSASRVGHSDLGVNRMRMEEIRQLWKSVLETSQQVAIPR